MKFLKISSVDDFLHFRALISLSSVDLLRFGKMHDVDDCSIFDLRFVSLILVEK